MCILYIYIYIYIYIVFVCTYIYIYIYVYCILYICIYICIELKLHRAQDLRHRGRAAAAPEEPGGQRKHNNIIHCAK